MNCTEFERLLNETIETRRPADSPSLREHAVDCAACRTLWKQDALLERAIPLWKDRVPEVDLTDAILAKVALDTDNANAHSRSDSDSDMRPPTVGRDLPTEVDGAPFQPAATRRHNARRLATLLAVVAAGLFLLVKFVSLPTGVGRNAPKQFAQDDDGNRPRPDETRLVQNDPDAKIDAAPDAEIDTLLRDAGSAYLGLAREAADAIAEARVFASVGDRRGGGPGNGGTLRPDGSGVVEQWRRGIEPIGRDVGEALDFLFDAVPMETAPAT